ncbi:2'-5' RNA ligase [Inquilinus ginsengisoli]|uniref:2'-5' RNA ligase n=1 Tax=Inquilinus ginsengisoli TaxID=363840 RepID=A0ABU1JLE3_9PROT|nr:2'-5' RNA ligase family protein [Inquilinus ginsengisoli]MDR6288364.1 2'-5' RNA ligase [Inquilinus ginsengisoli]
MAAKRRSGAKHSDPRQLWLDLGDSLLPPPPPSPSPSETPKSKDKVFFAISPGAAAATPVSELIDDLRHRYGLAGSPRPAEVLHISLLGLGGYQSLPSHILDAALRGASLVDVPQFNVLFTRAIDFDVGSGQHALVLRCDCGTAELEALQEAIVAAMNAVGLPIPLPSWFTPHMTLLYGSERFPEIVLDKPITLRVCDFTLVHSLYGRSIHQFLGRWPLRG